MGVSAYQLALEKGERYRSGQAVLGNYYFDRETRSWRPFDVFAGSSVPLDPPPSSPPASEVLRVLAPWVAVAGAAGLGIWWWRRK